MRFFNVAGPSFDGSGSGSTPPAPELLGLGVYWYDGDAIADGKTPHTGQGFTATLLLKDNSPNDTTTRVTGTGATISILHVENAYVITSWSTMAKWKGDAFVVHYDWDGSAWDQLLSGSPAPFEHGACTDGGLSGAFSGGISTQPHMAVITTDNITGSSFMSCSDSRPSA